MSEYDEERIPKILREAKSVAVVGISDKPERDSYRVAMYLMEAGYSIVPVNPAIDSWNGIRSYRNLLSIPEGIRVDVVDVFRKPEAAREIAEEAVKLHPRVLWLQEGVVNKDAADLAKAAGIMVVMDRCMMKEHLKLFRKG